MACVRNAGITLGLLASFLALFLLAPSAFAMSVVLPPSYYMPFYSYNGYSYTCDSWGRCYDSSSPSSYGFSYYYPYLYNPYYYEYGTYGYGSSYYYGNYYYGYPTGDTVWGNQLCYYPSYGRAYCGFDPNQTVYDPWTGTWY